MSRSGLGSSWLALTISLACGPVETDASRGEEAQQLSLFSAVLRELQKDTISGELRVDPRPLSNDPALVSLHGYGIDPSPETAGTWPAPYAPGDTMQWHARRELLAGLRIAQANGFPPIDCPGVRVDPTPEMEERKRRECPEERFHVVLVALARQGGAYWPDNVDERAKYADRNVHSVRIIARYFSPHGHVEASTDYIFQRHESAWVLLQRRPLLIVE